MPFIGINDPDPQKSSPYLKMSTLMSTLDELVGLAQDSDVSQEDISEMWGKPVWWVRSFEEGGEEVTIERLAMYAGFIGKSLYIKLEVGDVL